ncbi:MAG: hypothetical protein AAF299_12095 [Pseudomonadota bacterium]
MLFSALLTTFGNLFRLIGATVLPFGILFLCCASILYISTSATNEPYFTGPAQIERVPLEQVPDDIKSGYLTLDNILGIFVIVATASAAIATPLYSVILGMAFDAPTFENWIGYAWLISFGLILTMVTVRLLLAIDPLGESPVRSVKTSLNNGARLYLYSLAIASLSVLVFLVPSLIAVTKLPPPVPGAVNPVTVSAIIASFLVGSYIRCRLWVALPGIALGERPTFSQLWTRGRKLAVPLLLNNLLLSILIALSYTGLVFSSTLGGDADLLTWLTSFQNETVVFIAILLTTVLIATIVTISFHVLHIEAYKRMRQAEIEAA